MPAMEEVVSVKATGVRMHKRLGAHKAFCHGQLAQWERMYAREGRVCSSALPAATQNGRLEN